MTKQPMNFWEFCDRHAFDLFILAVLILMALQEILGKS